MFHLYRDAKFCRAPFSNKLHIVCTSKKYLLERLFYFSKLLVISKSFQGNSSQELVQCPICFKSVPKETIEQHADSCADSTSAEVLDIMSSQEETKRYLAM